jgi:twinkle protein
MIVNNANDTPITPSAANKRRSRRGNTGKQAKIVMNLACPACREKGKDSSGNHMMVFDTGKGYCDRCPKFFTPEEVQAVKDGKNSSGKRTFEKSRFQKAYQKEMTIEDIQHFGFLGDKVRVLKAETDRHFGIRTRINEGNATPLARYYPYYTEDDLYGYKVRELPKKWGTAIGTIKGTDLFGWHLCTGVRKTLIIVEGEEDCGAAWQMNKAMNMRSENRRIKRLNPHVVSLPNGAKGAQAALLHHIEDLMKYDKIIWMGDNYKIDPEGALALEAAVQVIGVDKLFVADYPDRKKDPCDILKMGTTESIDCFAEMYFNAKKYSPADIVDGADLELSDLEKEIVVGYELPFPSLQEKMQGLRLYEHTLIFSGSGIGKTSVCRALGHWMCAEHDWKVGNIYLEERFDKTAQGYVAYDNSVALGAYRKDFSIIPLEDKKASMENIINKMMFLNHNGCIAPDILMNKIRYLYNKGCKLIILDHISMAVTGSDDERRDIDSLMEQIYRFCETNPIHIISVVHLSRDSKRDFSRGAEITANNLRGSAGLLQMAWNAIGLEGDNQHEEHNDTRFMRILKCRETGEVGICGGGYKYSKLTGRFTYKEELDRNDILETKQAWSPSNKPTMGGGGHDNKAV